MRLTAAGTLPRRPPGPLTAPPPSPDRRENQGRDVVPSRVEDPEDAAGALDGFRLGLTIPRRVRGKATHHHRNRLRHHRPNVIGRRPTDHHPCRVPPGRAATAVPGLLQGRVVRVAVAVAAVEGCRGLNTHVSRAMRELVAARSWLRVYRLPPYASKLNPV
jgi:hypothetical protein